MRSLKSTTIKFGLVNVGAKVYKATDNHDVRLSQFHDGCGGGVGYTKICKCCDQTLATADIVKGAVRDDKTILVTEDDLAGLEIEAGKEIAVEQFVDLTEVDPIYFESHYFITPAASSDLEGYMTIRAVMAASNKAAIVRFVFRSSGNVGKQHLGLMAPYGDNAMILHTLAWADEVREPAFAILDTPVNLNPAVVKVATDLIDAMTAPFNPQAFADVYTKKLVGLIEAKANGKGQPKKQPEPEPVVSDLLAKLEASAAAKATKAKPAAKKAAPCKVAKKAPAKKAAPRRKTAVA